MIVLPLFVVIKKNREKSKARKLPALQTPSNLCNQTRLHSLHY